MISISSTQAASRSSQRLISGQGCSPVSRPLHRHTRPSNLSRPVSASRRTAVSAKAFLKAIGDAFNNGKKQYTIQQAGQYDVPAIQSKLQKSIQDNAVAVFSWTGCPYCKRAKALLDEVGAKYTPIELDLMGAEGKALRAELAKMTGRTSVPSIFIAKEYVGGCNDGPGIATLNIQGQLVPKLQAAGAL